MSMKVNEEKLLQAAVNYVVALVEQNSGRVHDKSPRGFEFEKNGRMCRISIDKTDPVLPARSDGLVITTEQALRDAVQSGRVGTRWIVGPDLTEWLFKVSRNKDNTRFKIYELGSDHSAISVVVNWRMHEPVRARAVAVELTEMLDAYVEGSVWMVSLYGRRTTSEDWHLYGQRRPLYGVSRVLLGMIELLTRQNLLSPGNGLRAISTTGMVYQEERT